MGVRIDGAGLQWIEKFVESEIKELHLMLEAIGLDENVTHMLRGRIQEARVILESANRMARTGAEI